MTHRIPDIWRTDDDARRLYELFLMYLVFERRFERAVVACRRVRAYAARSPDPRQGLFTFHIEHEALYELKRFATAWRQRRRAEVLTYGRRLDLWRYDWQAAAKRDPVIYMEPQYRYAPLLFALGKLDLGRHLLEQSLRIQLGFGKHPSYQYVLGGVYNLEESPTHHCRVTLWHFYRPLGLSLGQWEQWEAFVRGFPPGYFRSAGMTRKELLADAERLPEFLKRLWAAWERKRAEALAGPRGDKIRAEQEQARRRREEYEAKSKPRREKLNEKMRRLFPELRDTKWLRR